MLPVVCPNGHYTSKRGPSEWRHNRGCGVCGAATVADYGNRCTHSAWRYPNPLPIDGDLCPECGKEHVEPIRFRQEAELEQLRGIGELLSILLEESQGFYEAREATEALRDLHYAHRWTWKKGRRR